MREESNAVGNKSAALEEEPVPRSPWRVTAVEVLPDFRLRVAFADGLSGEVDLSGIVHSPKAGVFAALADEAAFAKVMLDHGAVSWPGELDLAPDAMHAAIQERGKFVL